MTCPLPNYSVRVECLSAFYWLHIFFGIACRYTIHMCLSICVCVKLSKSLNRNIARFFLLLVCVKFD